MPEAPSFIDALRFMWAIVGETWWFWVPPLLGITGWKLWRYYLKTRYFFNLQWVLLEVKIPRDIAKSPQAMEQIFAGLQTLHYEFDPLEIYWEGLQHDFCMFEMASMGGETKFYVRCPVFYRNVVEAQIYGQYPEAEIVEAEDYMNQLPAVIPNAEYDIFGIEFKLEKPDPYPIRTYIEFATTETMKEEERKIDPFASLAEVMGKIQPGEHIGYHLIMRPCQNNNWKDEGERLVSKLIGRKVDEKPSGVVAVFMEVANFISEIIAVLSTPSSEAKAVPKREEKDGTSLMQHLSPGTSNIVAAIERNILKPGWEVIIRFCYIARRDMFSKSHLSGFIGALRTYNTLTMNSFIVNGKAMATKTPWWWMPSWKAKRRLHKQRLFYSYYRSRKGFTDTWTLRSKIIVLNTEELATIYHYPSLIAQSPTMPKIESKRSEPPATLPVG